MRHASLITAVIGDSALKKIFWPQPPLAQQHLLNFIAGPLAKIPPGLTNNSASRTASNKIYLDKIHPPHLSACTPTRNCSFE